MIPSQTLVDRIQLKFPDRDGNPEGCVVSIKPMSTRDTLRLLPRIVDHFKKDKNDKSDGDDEAMGKLALDLPLVDEIWNATVVNIEAPGFKFRGQNPSLHIDDFSPSDTVVITMMAVNTIQLPQGEKKTSS